MQRCHATLLHQHLQDSYPHQIAKSILWGSGAHEPTAAVNHGYLSTCLDSTQCISPLIVPLLRVKNFPIPPTDPAIAISSCKSNCAARWGFSEEERVTCKLLLGPSAFPSPTKLPRGKKFLATGRQTFSHTNQGKKKPHSPTIPFLHPDAIPHNGARRPSTPRAQWRLSSGRSTRLSLCLSALHVLQLTDSDVSMGLASKQVKFDKQTPVDWFTAMYTERWLRVMACA